MLKVRILTVIIILPLFLAAIFYLPAIFWAALLLVLVVVGSQEWSRLAKLSVRNTILFMVLTTLLGGELLFLLSEAVRVNPYTSEFIWLYALSSVFWVTVAPIFLKLSNPVKNPIILMSMGWLLLLPTCLAMYQLREINPMLLLGFMGTIWISDSAAYFAGRAFGKHKLARMISPGKTWEGVAGALMAVLVYALVWDYLMEESLIIMLLPLLLLLVALGIIGDLFESRMKRFADVKDSGHFFPGHGGVLDRIDALTSTLPVAILAFLVFYSRQL
ncbi:phosphatidate cytidylyltransferase [Nitrosomonas cryotolerans]|uniref:Phosphatidate cytidylyltransferase n=1 Tax=Nitrosomonas cryotolerans ATCC 49181 TaxID=1131553 RepID=A0A1N6FBQ2_9PROT|nr:phosphatidate cytidylyltransferase [Nitrosomonas cryotolerans]SFP75244.1 phosphatidate cytidylyltransferase [Nitrosomonas cryotolerans]SIN92644.1 phosphatidate cytidylyltransferase [Nitrosomonas cryotolerans ATCC 49181]